MSEVHLTDTEEGILVVEGVSDATMVINVRVGLAFQPINGVGSASFNPSLASSLGAMQSAGIGTVDAFFRKNGEANVFPSYPVAGSSSASLTLKSLVDMPMISNGQGSASLDFLVQGNLDSNRLRFHLVGLPTHVETRFRTYQVKLTVDGTTLHIKSFSYSKTAVSMTFNAVLADLSQRSVVEAGTSFKFEINTIRLGVDDWRTVFDTSRRNASTYSVGWADVSPTDGFSFSIEGGLGNKLNKTPLRNLVIYDPVRTKVDLTNYRTVYDTKGNVYNAEIKSVSGLKLHYLLNEILVTRCGFTSKHTNIPDVPIKRLECQMTQTFFQSLKGLLGMYRLAIKQIGNEVWLLDKTLVAPVGFPAPMIVTTTDYKAIQKTKRNSKVEALTMNYLVNDTEAMYGVQTTRTEGDSLTSDGSYSNITETKWYSVEFPDLLITKTTDEVVTKTYANGTQVEEFTERYTYDSAKRPTNIQRDVQIYLPAIVGGTIRVSSGFLLQSAYSETEEYEYSSHPYIPFGVYCREITTSSSGLIAVDSQNQYLGQDFRQAIVEAHEAGNLYDGQTIDSGNYRKATEIFEPQPDGQVKHTIRWTNYLRKIAKTPLSSNKAGETYLSPNGDATKQLIVLSEDGDIPTGDEIEDFFTGELPMYQALPLTRRELDFRKNKDGDINATILGLNLDLDDGTACAFYSRDNEFQGNGIIETININGDNLGTVEQTLIQTIQADLI